MTTEIGNIDRPSPKQQVFRLLLVLGSAILLGCLIVLAMIYSWGPNGSYALSDILLAPETLPKLAYEEQSERIVFDHIDLRAFDSSTMQWRILPISVEAYQRFYAAIAQDRSDAALGEGWEQTNSANQLARLTLWVRPKNGHDRRVFQEVDIPVEGDTYRVELYGSSLPEWIYFKHADIGQLAHKVLLEPL